MWIIYLACLSRTRSRSYSCDYSANHCDLYIFSTTFHHIIHIYLHLSAISCPEHVEMYKHHIVSMFGIIPIENINHEQVRSWICPWKKKVQSVIKEKLLFLFFICSRLHMWDSCRSLCGLGSVRVRSCGIGHHSDFKYCSVA